MTAGMREGGKNSGQHPVWEKIAPPPAPASLLLEPAKRVTGPSQPTAWQGLTPHVPLSLSNFHLSILRAGSRDKNQLFPWEGWAEDVERSGEGNGCICLLPLLLGQGWASSRAT